jgi:hypothetical protein
MLAHCPSSPTPTTCHLSILLRSASASLGELAPAAALATKAFTLDHGPRPRHLFARAHFYSMKAVQEALDDDGDLFSGKSAQFAAEITGAMINAYVPTPSCTVFL